MRAAIRGLVQGGGTLTPESLLEQLPALEIISVFGVGYDGVPVDYCRRRGLKVTHTPDVLTDDVADVAVALILMTGRGFVRANRFVHAGEWQKRGAELTTKLAGRTVGILGLGRIGKAIAQARERDGNAGRVHRAQARRTCPTASFPTSKHSRRPRISWWSPARAAQRRRTSSMPRCSRRSARRARS